MVGCAALILELRLHASPDVLLVVAEQWSKGNLWC